jgi:hypothetical protein
VASRGAVDVTAEEVVNGDVPFAREFEPVAGIPPTVGKWLDLGASVEQEEIWL